MENLKGKKCVRLGDDPGASDSEKNESASAFAALVVMSEMASHRDGFSDGFSSDLFFDLRCLLPGVFRVVLNHGHRLDVTSRTLDGCLRAGICYNREVGVYLVCSSSMFIPALDCNCDCSYLRYSVLDVPPTREGAIAMGLGTDFKSVSVLMMDASCLRGAHVREFLCSLKVHFECDFVVMISGFPCPRHMYMGPGSMKDFVTMCLGVGIEDGKRVKFVNEDQDGWPVRPIPVGPGLSEKTKPPSGGEEGV